MTDEDYLELGQPAVGEALPAEAAPVLARCRDRMGAYEAALRILAFADNNRATLIRKLRLKGHSPEAAAWVGEHLCERRLIREDEQAYRYAVVYANRKLWGPKKIGQALLSKGYPAAVITDALRRAEEAGEVDFAALGEQLCRREAAACALPGGRGSLLAKYGYR